MASDTSIWFQIGHALERARQGAPKRSRVAGLAERARDGVAGAKKRVEHEARGLRRGDHAHLPAAEDLVAAGAALALDRILGRIGGKRGHGLSRLVRAGASGAVAALLVELVRPLVNDRGGRPTFDRAAADRLIAGAGQGVLYGALVDPIVPGPALAKGALYGTAEAVAHPAGGLAGLLGSHAPQKRLPIVGRMFEGMDPDDRAYLEHLVFGIALAVIYESSSSSSGIRPDES